MKRPALPEINKQNLKKKILKSTVTVLGGKSIVRTASKMEEERRSERSFIEQLLSVGPWGELADLHMASQRLFPESSGSGEEMRFDQVRGEPQVMG